MCGIAGIVNFSGAEPDRSILGCMTDVMRPRGPDDSGYFVGKGVGFGFRRLSIIDLTSGNQPITNEDGSVILVQNGEIYNFKELREELEGKGHVFKSQSDTEVSVHAYEEWGLEFVNRLNGMFAFALYDKKVRRVVLGRDRLGIKPLHYTQVHGTWVFGSELKSILQYPGFTREPNYSALSSYLTFRYPQGSQTVFKNILRLEPGHLLVLGTSGERFIKYWEIPFYTKKEDLGEKHYLERSLELLSKSVQRRMVSDVPVGAYLSGGLDSSIIVALMSRSSDKPVNTFSIGFPEDSYDERKHAEIVAKHCGTNHYPIALEKKDYMDMLPDVIRIKDAPISIPHEPALYQMSVELKKHVTVALSGEGADELFGGYGRVQRAPLDYKKIRLVQNFVPRVFQKPVLGFLGARQKAGEWLALKSHMEHFFYTYNWMPFEEKWGLLSDDLNDEIQHDRDLIKGWQDLFLNTSAGDPYDRILYMFEKRHLLCLLDRLDTMSMAASVEARVPFVDHELVEFASSIPRKYKMRWRSPAHKFMGLFTSGFNASEHLDQSKDILRNSVRGLLPDSIINRKKLGFPVPVDKWMASDQVKDILLDPRSRGRGLYKQDKLEELVNNKQNLDYDFWGKKIWGLLNIELWFQEFIDN